MSLGASPLNSMKNKYAALLSAVLLSFAWTSSAMANTYQESSTTINHDHENNEDHTHDDDGLDQRWGD
tara:strand:- start:218 stop:421 length:204 start_codon:yes stop_codon:yes gene_type:complete